MKAMNNPAVYSARITRRLDAANVLVVSVGALRVRIPALKA